ncbi:MAG: ATP-dependent DNA ligase, partial [Promethearchaeota archaeon]
MKFYELAQLFSILENTSKRLEMTDILSNFFKGIKQSNNFDDLNKIIYLLEGQLVSNIKQFPKMGIAEKTLIEALKTPSGWNDDDIKKKLREFGDIGATAEYILIHKKEGSITRFIFKETIEKPSIEISELHSRLIKITKIGGEKSQPKKLKIIEKILFDITPLEAKYLMRIITSTLRVGVSTQTIIDGLAVGFTGTKENRDFIENAYNLHPDLGEVTKILALKGLEEIKKIEITNGVPIRMMLASRVPYVDIINKLGSPMIAEYKLDGERLQIHKQGKDILLFSRRLLDISEQYPDVCEVIRNNISSENVIIEGEVVAMDHFYEKMLPFQVLSKRRRKYSIEEVSKEIPVC